MGGTSPPARGRKRKDSESAFDMTVPRGTRLSTVAIMLLMLLAVWLVRHQSGSHAARHASVEAWALEDMHHMVQLRRRAELLRGGAERDMDAELRMQVETGPKRTVTSIATPPRQIAAPRVQIVPAPASAASSAPPVAAKLEVPPQKNTKWVYGDWLCAAYTTGQDDAWCAKNPTASGFEYKMSHGDGTCGSCWCCRRSREVDDGKHPRPQVQQHNYDAYRTQTNQPKAVGGYVSEGEKKLGWTWSQGPCANGFELVNKQEVEAHLKYACTLLCQWCIVAIKDLYVINGRGYGCHVEGPKTEKKTENLCKPSPQSKPAVKQPPPSPTAVVSVVALKTYYLSSDSSCRQGKKISDAQQCTQAAELLKLADTSPTTGFFPGSPTDCYLNLINAASPQLVFNRIQAVPPVAGAAPDTDRRALCLK